MNLMKRITELLGHEAKLTHVQPTPFINKFLKNGNYSA